MKYEYLVREGEVWGTEIPTETETAPETSATGEDGGDGQFQEETPDGYTETETITETESEETETEETETETEEKEVTETEETEGSEDAEESDREEEDTQRSESDQYGVVQVDYSDQFSDLHDQIETLQVIGYATTVLLAASILFSLILRVLRN